MKTATCRLLDGWTLTVRGPDEDDLMAIVLEGGPNRRSVLFALRADGMRGDAMKELQASIAAAPAPDATET